MVPLTTFTVFGFVGARDRSEIAISQCAIKQGNIGYNCVKYHDGCDEFGWQVSLCGSVTTAEGIHLPGICYPVEEDSWRDSDDRVTIYDFDDNDRYITTPSSRSRSHVVIYTELVVLFCLPDPWLENGLL